MEDLLNNFNTLNFNDEKYIIIIQKYVRKFLIKKNILIPSSKYQTKKWRQKRNWYFSGKHNECEKYQIFLLEKILNKKNTKTYERLNIITYDIDYIKNPLQFDYGYNYTENFDGKIILIDKIIYFNLKFVCDVGGAQTRTLREVYHFIYCQIQFLLLHNTLQNIYFINILDGDTCYNMMSKFNYLINRYQLIKKFIFIGDMFLFQKYHKKYF